MVLVVNLAASNLAYSDQFVDYPKDELGRRIIYGPVGPGYYFNVHIISKTVGIYGDNLKVVNSVIEAPVCISVGGINNQITNNQMNCNLCIQFNTNIIVGNTLSQNGCSGQGTNRPDLFAW